MLWSLGAAALLGAAAMLFLKSDVILRVVGTAGVTGVAAGLMILMTFFHDRPATRNAGLLGLAFVLAEALMTLALIWSADTKLQGAWIDALGFTMLFLAFTAPPAMLMLRAIETAASRVAGYVGTALCAVVFLTLLYPAWFDTSWNNWEKHLGTSLTLAGYGLLVCGSLVGFGQDRRHWRWAGVAAAAVAAAMLLVAIWRPSGRGPEVFAVITTVAALVAHANLVLLVPLLPGQRWLAWATIAATVFCGAFIDALVIADLPNDTGLLARAAGACGILSACGTLALAVLARMNRKVERAAVALAHVTTFSLTCPGCQRKHTLPTGWARCPTCGLIVHCRFEEPHCPQCDYNLYNLKSDRCPECGFAVTASTSPPPLTTSA
jgi:hypothetical protein